MEGYYYEYELNYYDSDFDEKEKQLHGVVFANSYVEAMTYLTNFYGDDSIVEVKRLFPVESAYNIYEFNSSENSLIDEKEVN